MVNFCLVDHNDRIKKYITVGWVSRGQGISNQGNSRLGTLWKIVPSCTKLLENYKMSLQIKDSGVAYFSLVFTENKLCILKILLAKNIAGTRRM